ncbi:MAG TPA: hypothetical protein P5555_06900 [Candidatus Paceibacterota bacterium]|nr:hypothetical protein [Verrucomicrobiota bacterium]HOX02468.1 hypothetical protein [Verrucomicrobiota bacterium]HRZ44902.1 hypothetical protein [Candidatus Paceibacterota bacterium]HRZ91514.1 hypothetical protein [Candidatus Paceibacterota bacterium]
MNKPSIVQCAAGLLLLAILGAGCATRSISSSGYRDRINYGGELNEMEVLGLSDQVSVGEAEIRQAMARSSQVQVPPAAPLAVVQSGAMFPDDPMVAALQAQHPVIPLSGVPSAGVRAAASRPAPSASGEVSLHRAFRWAAAKAGAPATVVYWGVLESGVEDQLTKTISWVPIVGRLVPDQSEWMRIRLKAVVIDTASGEWVLVAPPPLEARRIAARINREATDQAMVNDLKARGYRDLAGRIQERCSI